MIAIVAAYALLTMGRVSAHSMPYIFLNITGALGLLLDSLSHKAYQSVAANLVWVAIGILSLIKILPL